MENIFSEFETTSKSRWLEQISKDLQGQDLEELFATFGPGLVTDPFLHEQDRINLDTGTALGRSDNHWLISEKITETIPGKINPKAFAALEGGASALTIMTDCLWSKEDFAAAFNGVYLDYIFIHFECPDKNTDADTFFTNFKTYLDSINLPADKINGSSYFVSLTNPGLHLAETFSGIRFFTFRQKRNGTIAGELAGLLSAAENLLHQAEDLASARKILNAIAFELRATDSFYLNIALVKALRLVWYSIQHAYGIRDMAIPFIRGLVSAGDKHTDPNTAVIRASSQALALSIAGTELIEIEPFAYDPAAFGEEFAPRIARNIQHILQLESFMDKVIDPALGSYFIDHLTQKLAREVWDTFKKSFTIV